MASQPAQGQLQMPGDPLAALRDIHLPVAPETWPPAIGWWLVLLATLLVFGYLISYLLKLWREKKYRREAAAHLATLVVEWQQSNDNLRFLNQLQSLLKQVALTRYGRDAVASLTGESWVSFLDRTGGTREFTMGDGQILIDGHYQSNANIDPVRLTELCQLWIKNHNDLPTDINPQINAGSGT